MAAEKTANGFPNEASQSLCQSDPFSLFLPPPTPADIAAPNSSQGRICINLIKMAKMIGIGSYIPPNH